MAFHVRPGLAVTPGRNTNCQLTFCHFTGSSRRGTGGRHSGCLHEQCVGVVDRGLTIEDGLVVNDGAGTDPEGSLEETRPKPTGSGHHDVLGYILNRPRRLLTRLREADDERGQSGAMQSIPGQQKAVSEFPRLHTANRDRSFTSVYRLRQSEPARPGPP